MAFEEQTWEDLLLVIETFYGLNAGATLDEVRAHVATEQIIENSHLTFGNAKRIDDILFGESSNTHWAEAFDFPQENSTVLVSGMVSVAKHVGVFTFQPSPC